LHDDGLLLGYALGAVAENDGVAQAEALAGKMEYCWNRNPDEDPFASG